MALSLFEKNKLRNIIVITIDEEVAADPVSLVSFKKKSLIGDGGAEKEAAFILKKRASPSEYSYHYLREQAGYITEFYLFSPVQFAHFKKKKACSELWHGCKIPSIDEIHTHAKILKLQEL